MSGGVFVTVQIMYREVLAALKVAVVWYCVSVTSEPSIYYFMFVPSDNGFAIFAVPVFTDIPVYLGVKERYKG